MGERQGTQNSNNPGHIGQNREVHSRQWSIERIVCMNATQLPTLASTREKSASTSLEAGQPLRPGSITRATQSLLPTRRLVFQLKDVIFLVLDLGGVTRGAKTHNDKRRQPIIHILRYAFRYAKMDHRDRSHQRVVGDCNNNSHNQLPYTIRDSHIPHIVLPAVAAQSC